MARISTIFGILAFILLLASCNAKRVERVVETQGADFDSAACQATPLQATLTRLQPASSTIRPQEDVVWQVLLSQTCNIRHRISFPSGQNFDFIGDSFTYIRQYSARRPSVIESVVIYTLDNNNSVVQTRTVQSESIRLIRDGRFIVGGCRVMVTPHRVLVPVGPTILPALQSFTAYIQAIRPAQVSSVTDFNGNVVVTEPLPTPIGIDHMLHLSIGNLGFHPLQFILNDNENNTLVCRAVVWIEADPIPPPQCTMTVSPNAILKGESANLALSVQGNVTSVSMSPSTVQFPTTGGQLTVSPTATTTYVATLTGPHGGAQCSVTLNVSDPPSATCSAANQLVSGVDFTGKIVACTPSNSTMASLQRGACYWTAHSGTYSGGARQCNAGYVATGISCGWDDPNNSDADWCAIECCQPKTPYAAPHHSAPFVSCPTDEYITSVNFDSKTITCGTPGLALSQLVRASSSPTGYSGTYTAGAQHCPNGTYAGGIECDWWDGANGDADRCRLYCYTPAAQTPVTSTPNCPAGQYVASVNFFTKQLTCAPATAGITAFNHNSCYWTPFSGTFTGGAQQCMSGYFVGGIDCDWWDGANSDADRCRVKCCQP